MTRRDTLKYGKGEVIKVYDMDKHELRQLLQILLDYLKLEAVVKSVSRDGMVIGLQRRTQDGDTK